MPHSWGTGKFLVIVPSIIMAFHLEHILLLVLFLFSNVDGAHPLGEVV